MQRLKGEAPRRIGNKKLGDVAGHDGEVGVWCSQTACIAFDPRNRVGMGSPSGNLEHFGRRIDAHQFVLESRQLAGDDAGPASKVDDGGRPQVRGELGEEGGLSIRSIRIRRVIDRHKSWISELG